MTPEEIDNLAGRVMDAFAAGNYVGGLAMADQLVRARPAVATFRYWRAHALLHLGEAVAAYQEARVATDLDEHLYQAHLLMAGAAVKLGRTTDARRAFERAVEASDRQPGIMADYASYLASEGGARLAEQAAIQAIQADGQSSNAWAEAAWEWSTRPKIPSWADS